MSAEDITIDVKSNITTAYDIGLIVPGIPKMRNNLHSDEINEMLDSGKWKEKGDVLIEKTDGVPITYTAYWDGEKYSLHTAFLRDRFICCGSRGPELLDNLVTAFEGNHKQVRKYFKNIVEKLGDFKGFVTFDVILSHDVNYEGEKIVYYDGIHTAVTDDMMVCLCRLYGLNPETFWEDVEGGLLQPEIQGKYTVSTRLYSYPYHVDMNKKMIKDASGFIEGSECFIASELGERIKDAWKSLYSTLRDMPNYVCFRNDGQEYARKTFARLKSEGLI